MSHKHETYSAGRDFVELCACGKAIRRVGDEVWFEKGPHPSLTTHGIWEEELWDLYYEKFQVRHEGDPRESKE